MSESNNESLADMVREWGAPGWVVDGLAAYLRAGGDLDRDLWVAVMAAARDEAAERGTWSAPAWMASRDSRRAQQAEHDAAALDTIRESRAAGLSWRKTAQALDAAGVPPPRAAPKQRNGRAGSQTHWDHSQVRRIARRLGID